jgi:hypothetical protein
VKRLAVAGAIVLATAACGTGDEAHHQWVGSPDVPHRDSPSFHPADPTSGLADRLALLRAPRQRAGRSSRSRSVIVPARNSTPSGDGGCTLSYIREHESGNNYSAVSKSGRYRGAYQFDMQTWRSVGGVGDPAAASPAEQDARAERLMAERGTQPWSVCH